LPLFVRNEPIVLLLAPERRSVFVLVVIARQLFSVFVFSFPFFLAVVLVIKCGVFGERMSAFYDGGSLVRDAW
jgi:hypothetical protein